MIPEIFAGSQSFTASHLSKREFIDRSDLVICISEATRNDLLTVLGESVADRTVVIPCSVDPSFTPGLPPLPGLPESYCLYVGGRGGYKDFHILIEALGLLCQTGLDVPFVVVGKSLATSELQALQRAGLAHLISQRALDDASLKRAYSNALVLVQTSRYEGFGLTALEGMASGLPVVLADASAMPEVGGTVARYFQPGNSESLAATLRTLLEDDRDRTRLGRLGTARARLFSTRAMAERTAQAYARLL